MNSEGGIVLNLKEIREAKGFSKYQVAKEIGITWQQYHKYETGDSSLNHAPYKTVSRIASYFGLTTDELMQEINKSPES